VTSDRDSLLKLSAGVVLYFLLAFIVYAASDYAAWQQNVVETFRESRRREEEQRERGGHHAQYADTKPHAAFAWIVLARGVLDFLLPVVLAIVAVVMLI
jgi:hypothetical protein